MIRASQILFWFGLSIAASLALYHTSDRTRALEHQLHTIDAAVDSERESIHVLNAEWVYLANPARVEAETKKYLALRPTAPKQVIALSDLGGHVPTRTEAMEQVAVTSTPIANVAPLVMPPPLPARRLVAAVDRSHINSRMIMSRTASASSHDEIGTLLSELGTHR